MRDKRSKKLLWCFLLSFLLHALLFMLMLHKPAEKQVAEAVPLDIEILQQPKRIADIAKPKQQQRPKKADFIGEYDSTVKEEKVAVTPPKPGTPQPQQAIKKPPTPEPQQKKSLAARYAMKREQARKKNLGSPESALKKPGQFPDDFYPDYKIGPHTYLNVYRFPDIQYFVRLKRIFKTTFNPGPALRPYFYTNQISRGHVEVVLGVTVDAQGRLARLFVIRSSGLDGYNQEALRTIRDSSPFSKPPAKILGPDGMLRMSWTFTVYM